MLLCFHEINVNLPHLAKQRTVGTKSKQVMSQGRTNGLAPLTRTTTKKIEWHTHVHLTALQDCKNLPGQVVDGLRGVAAITKLVRKVGKDVVEGREIERYCESLYDTQIQPKRLLPYSFARTCRRP